MIKIGFDYNIFNKMMVVSDPPS